MKSPDSENLENYREPMEPNEVASTIAGHMRDCAEAHRSGAPLLELDEGPISLDDYLKMCDAYLPVTQILPDALLKARIKYLQQDGKLKMHFPAGSKCCVAVLPITPRGIKMERPDLEKGNFQTSLIIDENGRTINGFGIAPSYIFDLLPAEIQEACTFEIPPYDSDDLWTVTGDDRKRIIKAFTEKFKNARDIFNRGNI